MEIGPFTIHERIGQGAMGDVWRATHDARSASLALKVITPMYAAREKYRRRFYNEIRAAAGLDHPGVIEIFDYGEVDRDAAADSGLEFRAGSPYLAMEFADGGSLAGLDGDADWTALRSLLIDVLRALGHAHSRGVIHRDLKPSNVLIAERLRGGDRFKLTDFGLAFEKEHAIQRDESGEGTVGTPHYMAPEQFRSRWRDYGPWTDLYGLGCLAWELATGRVPFAGETLLEAAYSHVEEPMPAFEPTVDVPPDFDRWLARLLQKHPADRFRRAADALWGLLELDPEPAAAFPSQGSEATPLAAVAADEDPGPRHRGRMPSSVGRYAGAEAPAPEETIEPMPRRVPPLPEDWTQRHGRSRARSRMSVGLELFSLRDFPTVGRHEERDRLWNALREVVRAGRSRMVFVRGDAGVGKTRLARWLRERAEELGAANSITATHDRRGAAGLVLGEYFRVADCNHEEMLEHIEEWYRVRGVDHAFEWRAMAALIESNRADDADPDANEAGSEEGEPTSSEPQSFDDASPSATPPEGTAEFAPLTSAHERRALLRRFLEYASRERPLVVHLDNLQWGLATLHYLRAHFESPEADEIPVLFVGTIRNDALAERPLEARLVDELTDREGVETVDVGPMSETDQRFLIEKLLHLEPGVAHQIVQSAGGNPLFAVELVRDWIDRGLLEPGPDGFHLPEGVDPEIPANLYDVWRERLDELTRDRPDGVDAALQLGATLGTEIDEKEWRAACEAADLRFPIRTIEEMLRRNLLHETDRGWRFAHNMIQQTLVRNAREAGDWRRWNEVCADIVADTPAENRERLAEFAMEAGDRRRALEPLLDAVDRHSRHMQYDEAEKLFESAIECAEEVDLEVHPQLAAKLEFQRGRVAFNSGRDLEAADAAFERAERLAADHGFDEMRARALTERASVAHQRHDYRRAIELAERARDLLSDDDSLVATRADLHLAHALRRSGRDDRARELFERVERSARGRFPAEHLKCLVHWANLLKNSGELEAAREKARQAMETSERFSSPATRGRVLNLLGDIARLDGALDEARRWYRRAEEFADLVDDPGLGHVYLGRVQVELEERNFDRAVELLDQLRGRCTEPQNTWFTVATLAFESSAIAGFGDWSALGEVLDDLEEIVAERAPNLPSAIESLQLAADLAAEAEHPEIADRCRRAAERLST